MCTNRTFQEVLLLPPRKRRTVRGRLKQLDCVLYNSDRRRSSSGADERRPVFTPGDKVEGRVVVEVTDTFRFRQAPYPMYVVYEST